MCWNMDSCLLAGNEAASTCCSHSRAWSCSLVNKIPVRIGLLRRKGMELVLLGFFPIYLPIRLAASKIQLTFQRTSSCWGWRSLKSLVLSLKIVNATQIHSAPWFCNFVEPGLEVEENKDFLTNITIKLFGFLYELYEQSFLKFSQVVTHYFFFFFFSSANIIHI